MNSRDLAASTIERHVGPKAQHSKSRIQESRNRPNGDTASVSSANLKLKNTFRQKLPKVKSFFSNINNRRVNKEATEESSSKLASLQKSPPHVTVSDEYENSAAIPFSHIFVDDSDEGVDSNRGSTSSINTFEGLSLAKMKGLKHSSTLPPMSEHQKKNFLRDMKKSKYAGMHKNNSKVCKVYNHFLIDKVMFNKSLKAVINRHKTKIVKAPMMFINKPRVVK